jgi:hypothetical protein
MALTLLVIPSLILGLSISSESAQAWKTKNHPTILDFAINVLEEDNYTYLVTYLIDSGALERVKKAVEDCDRIDLAANHYYNPVTGQGLSSFTPADTIAQSQFDSAVELFQAGDLSAAWYHFGWSLHIVQDLFVPFHSNLDPLNGHTDFEQYAYDYRFFFPSPENGTYNVGFNASDWVQAAAAISYPYYDGISGVNATDANFDIAAMILFPQAIGATAGFIKFFADTVGLGDFNLYCVDQGINFVTVQWDIVLDQDFTAYEIFVSQDKDDIFDGDPYAVITDRQENEKTIVHLTLGEKYYVKVQAHCGAVHQESNLLKVSPRWDTPFYILPGVTFVVAILYYASLRHRQARRVRK